MTVRTAGLAAAVAGVAIAVWSWLGLWPLPGPAIYSGSDFAAVNSVGLGVSILGSVLAMVGAFLVFAGRGGPDDWGQR